MLSVFELSQMIEEPTNLDEVSEAVHEINQRGGTVEAEDVAVFNEKRKEIINAINTVIEAHKEVIRDFEETRSRIYSLDIDIRDEE